MLTGFIRKSDGEVETFDTTEALTAASTREGVSLWIDLEEPTEDEVHAVGRAFRLDAEALEDCLHGEQRPRIDEFEDCIFLVLYGALRPDDTSEFEPRKPETTRNETWPDDGDIASGQDLTWTETENNFTVASNQVYPSSHATSTDNSARAAETLSSDDHYAQIQIDVLTNTSSSGGIDCGAAFVADSNRRSLHLDSAVCVGRPGSPVPQFGADHLRPSPDCGRPYCQVHGEIRGRLSPV